MHSKLLLAELRRQRGRPGLIAAGPLTTRRRVPPYAVAPASCSRCGELPGEGAEGLAVGAADQRAVLAAFPRRLGLEAQPADGLRSARTARARASLGSPSTHIVRSLSCGGSLTPSTRFQASSRPSAASRRRRSTASACGARSRRPCRRSPRGPRAGAVDAVDGDRPPGADAALLARPGVARAAAADGLDARGLLELEVELRPCRRDAHPPRASPSGRPAPEPGALVQATARPGPRPPRRSAGPARPAPRRAQHQLRAEHADVAPGLQRPQAADGRASAAGGSARAASPAGRRCAERPR